VLAEVAFLGGAREDRHHPGDAAAAGDAQHVLREARMERRLAERAEEREPRPGGGGAAEEPLGHAAARLLLHDELEPACLAREVDHRVAAEARDPRRRDRHELAGVEVERAVQFDVERQDVVREAPRGGQDALHRTGRAGAGIGRIHEAGNLGDDVAGRRALAHQELARALQVLLAARVRPGVLGASRDEPRLAGAAGPGRALVGQVDVRAQARKQDLLARFGVELVGPVPRVDLHPHRFAPGQNGTW
jgi:hypothetical protein